MSARKKPQTARKQPQQARSTVTVQAVLDGCIRVLEQEGAAAMTTTRIAAAAGVSVGTLYQYFADKDAILEALQAREFERATQMLTAALGQGHLSSERELARAIIQGLLDLYRSAPALHRLLAIDGLRVSPTDRVLEFDRKIVETLRGFLEVSPFTLRRKSLTAASFVLYQSVRATMLAAILEQPAGLSDEILVHELTDLVVGHLIGPETS